MKKADFAALSRGSTFLRVLRLASPHLAEQYLADATEVVKRFLQVGFWQVGRRVALLYVAFVMCSSFLGWIRCVGEAAEWRTELVASIRYKLFKAVLAGIDLLEHATTFVLSGHNDFSIDE
jgi:hypothetical protein